MMHLSSLARAGLLCALAALGASGCGQHPAGPRQEAPVFARLPEDSLEFLSPALDAPALGVRSVRFYAVKGQDREVRLMYRPRPGELDSAEFARFKVDKRSLVNRPDGTPLAPGDSVLITLAIVDTLRLIIDFQPSGLRFNPQRPARLWIKFWEADPDLDHDGAVTPADSMLLLSTQIWGQHRPARPWSSLPSQVDVMTQDVEARIPGFTRYAVAY